MQRRVAAIYLVFFVVMGASAYSVIAMAEQPTVDIPGQEYENGSTFTAGGTEYTVLASMEEPSGEEGGSPTPVGSLAYQNGSETEEITLEEGANVTLADDTQYFAHFRTGGEEVSVVIAQTAEAYGAYQGDLARQDNFQQRTNGLWGVVILSVVVSLLVVPLAYMPVKG
jgi:hypothetical protein